MSTMQNNQKPLFSIVIPTYNRAEFIGKAIQSVKDQLFNDWELIVVDDGSTDNTKEVVFSFNDNRIKYVYQKNQERSIARNRGIKEAKGEYICFLDSDDWYLQNHLVELRKNIIKRSHPVAFFYIGQYFYKKDSFHQKKLPNEMGDNPVEHVLFYTIYPTSVCIHKDIFNKFLFETYLIPTEDMGLWMQIAANYPIYQINKFTCVVNIHEASSTQTISQTFTLRNSNDELNKLSQVFVYDTVKDKLSKAAIRRYRARYYYYYFYNSVNRRKLGYMIIFFFKYLYNYPQNLFRINTYVALYDMIKAYKPS